MRKYRVFVYISRDISISQAIYEFDTIEEADLAFDAIPDALVNMKCAYSVKALYKKEDSLPVDQRVIRTNEQTQ